MKSVLVTSWIPAFQSSPLLVFFLFATLPSVLHAEKEIRIPAGHSADAWWGVNASFVYFNMTGNSFISEGTLVAVERLRTLLNKYEAEQVIYSGKDK